MLGWLTSCSTEAPLAGRIIFSQPIGTVGGGRQIAVIDASGDRSTLRPITSGAALDDSPALSADGRLLAFRRAPATDADRVRVVVRDMTTASEYDVPLPDADWNAAEPFWDPSGTVLGFTRHRLARVGAEPGSGRLWVVVVQRLGSALRFGHAEQISPVDGRSRSLGTWNPVTGSDIVYVNETGTPDQLGPYEIWRAPYPGQSDGVRVIGRGCCGVSEPSYSPDATRVAFSTLGPGLETFITVAKIDGSGMTSATCSRTWSRPKWSPDGRSLLVQPVGVSPGLYRVPAPAPGAACAEPTPIVEGVLASHPIWVK